MEDYKCGRIPPCYSGKKFRIHEELEKIKAWDDTHDIVYGLNRQMCDLGKTMNDPMKPLSEEAIQNIAKALEITRKPKGIIMEEKKTKKMTKAEAFEYLTYKKVACYNRKEVDIQNKLFEIGFKWCDGTTVEVAGMFDFLLIDDGTFQFTDNVSHFRKHAYEEIEMDDILSIEIVDEKKNELEFNYDKVVELAKPLMLYLNEVGFHDSIRVSQFGIVHEPMSTLIFDNGIGE